MHDDTSRFLRIAGLSLGCLFCVCSVARADEYQDAIAKAFPGFQIMSRSEFDPQVRKEVKGNPGLITGHFNDDELEDFAAIIRSNVKQKFPSGKDHYSGKFVVCHRLPKRGYSCEVLGTRIVDQDLDLYLHRVPPGFSCPEDGGRKSRSVTKRDAIGFAAVGSNPASVHIYTRGTYVTCVTGD